ncbi:MAG: ATP-binding cassette domain-containing protein [Dehalococcoidales bacterium]|nr:ATP-binding cassette domain-containing protein [Dehalococcoidales bacterium]
MTTDTRITRLPKVLYGTLLYSWQAAPRVLALFIVLSFLLGFQQVFEIYGLQLLFDTLVEFIDGNTGYSDVLRVILLLGGISLLLLCIESAQFLAGGHLFRRVNCHLQSLLHLKAGRIDPLRFEITDTYNEMKNAMNGSSEAPSASRGIVEVIAYYVPFFILSSVYLYTVQPLVMLSILFIFLPVLISEFVRASAFYTLEGKTAGIQRKYDYYQDCIASRIYFKETRTLGAFNYFFNLFKYFIDIYNSEIWKTAKKVAIIDIVLGIINIAGFAGVLLLLTHYLNNGTITVGMFAAVFYSVDKFNKLSRQLVQQFGATARDARLGSYLLDYLQAEERTGISDPLDIGDGIQVRNVSFQYPGTVAKALDNISLTIHKGESIAIVGINGAGKTTLTRVITGLYFPTKGKVLFGGKDISQYGNEQLFRSTSAVFQTYQKYRMDLEQNVLISDALSGNDVSDSINRAGVNLDTDDYPQGIHTMLSREFGGIDLSGGQWQRIAIARGFYREHELIILDEPTAAIDPMEETRVYEKFLEAVKGKTSIIVTHRLGSARLADRIIVMDKGKIIETGIHRSLMDNKGAYYHMFSEQAIWYQR